MSFAIHSEGAVLYAEIDRPDALNAIDFSVMKGLEDALELLQRSPGLRVFVLRGQGSRAFVAGGDLRAFHALTTHDDVERMGARMHAILNGFERLDCWTIASINGDAYGGGCELALAFDFRIASDHARFGFTQARFHLTPGWGGLTRLVECVGRRRALGWLAQCAVLDTEQALATNLIDRIAPASELQAATRAWAEELAVQDRELIGALKQGALRALELPRSQAIAAEMAPFCALWTGDEHQARVEQFLKRKPTS
ncbi:MAG: enoyl-CoA hydratase/isomerase family protein [Bradymonadaceae bacterium]|nr:enoyl-CoA hydratase/isomerase family protein [Lujinxingiaceae bacterium]